MKERYAYLFLALVILIMGLSAVSASDTNGTDDNTLSAEVNNANTMIDNTREDINEKDNNGSLNKNAVVDKKSAAKSETSLNYCIYDENNDYLYMHNLKYNTKFIIQPFITDNDNSYAGNDDISVIYNNKTYVTKNNGKINLQVNKVGHNQLSCYFNGNNQYAASSCTMKFSVPKTSIGVILDNNTLKSVDGNINIKGKVLTYEGQIPITNSKFSYIITEGGHNSEAKLYATTDDSGNFNIAYPGDKTGLYHIEFAMNATDFHNALFENLDFYIIEKDGKISTRPSLLTFDHITSDTYRIHVDLYDAYFNLLPNEEISVNVEGKTYKINTGESGSNGYFTHSFSNYGLITLKESYAGNSKYAASTITEYYLLNNFYGNTETKLTVNSFNNVKIGDILSITGKLTDLKGNPIKNDKVNVTISGGYNYQSKFVTTDNNGVYKCNANVQIGYVNDITVNYYGTSKYRNTQAYTMFDVENPKNETYIHLCKPLTTNLGNNVAIKGNLSSWNTPLRYTPVVININGKEYTNTTEGNGDFTYNYKTDKIGVNNVTVTYKGNAKFHPITDNVTFKVLAQAKNATKITVNSAGTVQVNNMITVTGKFTDVNGNNLRYTPIKITINGKTYTNNTDAYGIYKYTFKATTLGTNNITVSYPGNARYIGATSKSTFTVKQ